MNKDFWNTQNEETRDLTGHNLPEGQRPLETLSTAEDIPAMASKDIARLKDKYKELLDIIERAPEQIENDAIYNRFTALVGQVKDAQEDREKTKKKLKDPYNKAATAIENEFKLMDGEKELRKDLDNAFAILKSRMSIYDTKKYEDEEKSRRAEQERLAATAADDGIVINTDEITPVKLGAQKSEHGGTSVRKVVETWEVTDENLLPRSVLSVDPKKVEQLISSGAKEIPGIKISKKVETSVRRS